jgi:hypothetical protein
MPVRHSSATVVVLTGLTELGVSKTDLEGTSLSDAASERLQLQHTNRVGIIPVTHSIETAVTQTYGAPWDGLSNIEAQRSYP